MPQGMEFFWSPPDGAHVLGMTNWRGVIIVATSTGLYCILEKGQPLPDWELMRVDGEPNAVGTK